MPHPLYINQHAETSVYPNRAWNHWRAWVWLTGRSSTRFRVQSIFPGGRGGGRCKIQHFVKLTLLSGFRIWRYWNNWIWNSYKFKGWRGVSCGDVLLNMFARSLANTCTFMTALLDNARPCHTAHRLRWAEYDLLNMITCMNSYMVTVIVILDKLCAHQFWLCLALSKQWANTYQGECWTDATSRTLLSHLAQLYSNMCLGKWTMVTNFVTLF